MKNYNVNNGDLILVNSDYKFVTKNFEMNLVKFDNLEIYLDSRAMSALLQIFKKLNITDEILPVSGYRHSLLQKDIYENSLVDNGEVFTKKYVALPGHSEHET
ncbi:MAG: D-alanyl-D-alanine carboxypeptidase family protein, partial [Neofamilia sp.]